MNIAINKVIIFIIIVIILIILIKCFTITEPCNLDGNLDSNLDNRLENNSDNHLENNSNNYLINHTLIISYPINYNIFPLARKCKFIEINLDENEYISIPQNWMHWVFTEPYNFSISYRLFSFDKNNQVINNLIKKKPHKNKIDFIPNFKDFFKKNLETEFLIYFNTTNNITPVKKPNLNCKTFKKNMSIKKSLGKEYNDYYKYIAMNEITDLFLMDLSNFINITNKNDIYIRPSQWINLDKSINSGLHWDENDNILINFIGKKRILLAHPKYRKYMYFQRLPIIDYK